MDAFTKFGQVAAYGQVVGLGVFAVIAAIMGVMMMTMKPKPDDENPPDFKTFGAISFGVAALATVGAIVSWKFRNNKTFDRMEGAQAVFSAVDSL